MRILQQSDMSACDSARHSVLRSVGISIYGPSIYGPDIAGPGPAVVWASVQDIVWGNVWESSGLIVYAGIRAVIKE